MNNLPLDPEHQQTRIIADGLTEKARFQYHHALLLAQLSLAYGQITLNHMAQTRRTLRKLNAGSPRILRRHIGHYVTCIRKAEAQARERLDEPEFFIETLN